MILLAYYSPIAIKHQPLSGAFESDEFNNIGEWNGLHMGSPSTGTKGIGA